MESVATHDDVESFTLEECQAFLSLEGSFNLEPEFVFETRMDDMDGYFFIQKPTLLAQLKDA